MEDLKQSVHALIAERVRSRLAQHSIDGDRATWLADALSLSRAQIFRKLKGRSPWAIEEVLAVARIFECSAGELLQDLLGTASTGAGQAHHGLMTIDGVLVRCAFELGEPGIGLYALASDSTWRLVATPPQPVKSAPAVRHAEILGLAERPRPLVLLIDDEVPFTTTMCHALERFGFSAIAITSTSALAEKLERFAYIDAFVLDWSTTRRAGEDLINITCTSRHATSPVVLLVAEGDDADIASVNNGGRVLALQKPLSPSTLTGALDNLLNRQAD